ncbi:L-seryl-tRNA(Sec) kinase [Pelodytes ibericus]
MSESSRKRRLVVCLLCGLPGSGKSTLCQSLQRRNNLKQCDVAVIGYDDVISTDAFQEETSDWKQHRQQLLDYIKCLIVAFMNSTALVDPESRLEATWQRFISCLGRQCLISPTSGIQIPHYAVNIPESHALCLVLDDNFYYQSMRYEVYQLARKYSVGFCQIYLRCPVEHCLTRNRNRPFPVPDQIIRLMALKIEEPNPEKNTWEQNSLILDSSEKDRIEQSRITDLVNHVLENPLSPLQDDRDDKEQDRAICAANVLHQADKCIRHLISETMQTMKGTVSVSELKRVAQDLQGTKSKLLEELRHSMSQSDQLSLRGQNAEDIMPLFKEQIDCVVHPYLVKNPTDCT